MAVVRTTNRRNKHFVLDQAQLSFAQKVLGTRTETETIDRALEIAITETERNRHAWNAHDKFIRAGMDGGLIIEDVFGHLEDE